MRSGNGEREREIVFKTFRHLGTFVPLNILHMWYIYIYSVALLSVCLYAHSMHFYIFIKVSRSLTKGSSSFVKDFAKDELPFVKDRATSELKNWKRA